MRLFQHPANGKEIAYLIKENDKWCLMMGNKKYGEDYEKVWSMRYSPTENSFVFKGKKDGLTFVNFGTKKSEGYKSVWNIALSPDGNHLSFVASNGGKQFLVCDFINDKQEYSYICDPVIYSSDSKSLAYVVVENKKSFVVNNGKMLREFEAILLPSFYSSMFRISYFRNSVIAFSPEGKKLVFLAFAEGKMLLVCNDSQSAPFDYIGGSSHSNGVSFFQNGSKVTLSSAAGASFMVGGADLISSDPIFHFNANGSQVAFGAKAGKDFLWKVIDLK